MKIVTSCKEAEKKSEPTFCSLKPGDAFDYMGITYIKTDTRYVGVNAIRLSEGQQANFGSSTCVVVPLPNAVFVKEGC